MESGDVTPGQKGYTNPRNKRSSDRYSLIRSDRVTDLY